MEDKPVLNKQLISICNSDAEIRETGVGVEAGVRERAFNSLMSVMRFRSTAQMQKSRLAGYGWWFAIDSFSAVIIDKCRESTVRSSFVIRSDRPAISSSEKGI
jgi:hypothetical protein